MFIRIKNKAKSLVKRYTGAGSQSLERRFETELALINGEHENDSTLASILHFSFNKAGTQYVKSILSRLADEQGMVTVSIHDYAFHSDFPYLDSLTSEEMADYQHLFVEQGYLYSVFGGMIDGIEGLENYKTILVSRDPRDILVSEYFSVAFSHVVPDKTSDKYDEFMANRDTAQEISIDDYVIAQSDKVLDIFERYCDLLLDRYKHCYLTKYEKMVSDFPAWLDELVAFCPFEVSGATVKELIERHEASKPKAEDVSKHQRKGKAGDYKEKLKPETIQQLNEKFAAVLDRFGYALH
ncbi:MAG: sulfotransferase domain-containing protein [Phycisphaeraceae bacterium]|nr:sulfotransferase domain-containing protein [Phycisphaeraceae bacterium]